MRTLEASGKTVDEAIFNGLRELGVSIDEVEIDIVQHETKGILGIGAKPAIVKLTEKEPEQIIIPDYMNEAERRSNRREKPRRDRDDKYRREDRPRREKSYDKGYDKPYREDRRSERVKEKAVEVVIEEETSAPVQENVAQSEVQYDDRPVYREKRQNKNYRERSYRRERDEEKPNIEYTLEAAENNEAAEFVRQLLKMMDVEANVLANVSEEEGVRLRIDSSGQGVLIGHRGETLDAIQYLTGLHINRDRKEKGYTRVTVDTEGYRERREETLARLARKIASQVRSTGRARTLEPMNPYERRVLHATLQGNPYVVTFSEGEEPNRRVVIAPKKRDN